MKKSQTVRPWPGGAVGGSAPGTPHGFGPLGVRVQVQRQRIDVSLTEVSLSLSEVDKHILG